VGRTHFPLHCTNVNAPMVRFSATLGGEPKIELAYVIVPLCTENVLHFSVHLGDGAPKIRLERLAVN
jgi:hypothetical protein